MTTTEQRLLPTRDQVHRAPKVLLHDHLDGGLRPQTILDLAPGAGHTLPADDAVALGRWFEDSANSGSLERYLETFDHTVAVMQSAENLRRVAQECVEDLATDGRMSASQGIRAPGPPARRPPGSPFAAAVLSTTLVMLRERAGQTHIQCDVPSTRKWRPCGSRL